MADDGRLGTRVVAVDDDAAAPRRYRAGDPSRVSGEDEEVVRMALSRGSGEGPAADRTTAGPADVAGHGRAGRPATPAPSTLRGMSEADLLAEILPRLRGDGSASSAVVVPAGDDAAVLAVASGTVVATTDTMVRGRDWRDEWSSGRDVGAKVVAQNLADLAAMGAVGTGLLVALVADPDTELAWVRDLADGIAAAAAQAAVPVVGGDLSGAPAGVVVVAVTALGDLGDRRPVLRSGARPGDVVAVAGSLGRSGAGLVVLARDGAEGADRWSPQEAAAVAAHRAPTAPYAAGPRAAEAGATAMIDISDGLLRDAGRVAGASGVRLDLSEGVLREAYAAPLAPAVGAEEAWRQVLTGGEEHSLLACFPALEQVPPGGQWRVVGRVLEAGPEGAQVTVDGRRVPEGGWDHFAG